MAAAVQGDVVLGVLSAADDQDVWSSLLTRGLMPVTMVGMVPAQRAQS